MKFIQSSTFYDNYLTSMSTSKDPSSAAAKTAEADQIINRLNISLARSQKLINSWLPPKFAEEIDQEQQSSNDIDEDFRSMTDSAGIGSKSAYGDDESSAALLRKKRLASGDKLLEQLLGKKAAQAHKKTQQPVVGKSMAASRHMAPKPVLASRPKAKRDESESEEEGGRSSAFKSRRESKMSKPSATEDDVVSGLDGEVAKDEPSVVRDDSDSEDRGMGLPAPKQSAKNKPGASYLDEVLSQKAKKRKKKAKHTADNQSGLNRYHAR